jgi:hypothetical protein
VLDAKRFTCLPRVPSTPRPSMSIVPYSAVSSSQSRLPASATRRPISVQCLGLPVLVPLPGWAMARSRHRTASRVSLCAVWNLPACTSAQAQVP